MTRSEPSDSWRQLRERLEGDGGLGDEPSRWPGIIEDNRRRYERLREAAAQRPSPEGLHAQRLREDDATYGAGSEAARIVDGLAGFRAATPTTAEAAANLERALGRHDGEGRCAESRERVEPTARVREEPLNESPASTLPSGVALPVPWYELREAVRAAIRSMEGDDLRRVPCDDDVEDELVELICAAALREVASARASNAGELAALCFVPGCSEPRYEAFAETWYTCEKHAPSAAREKAVNGGDQSWETAQASPPRVPLRCRIGFHRWDRGYYGTLDRGLVRNCTRCGRERP